MTAALEPMDVQFLGGLPTRDVVRQVRTGTPAATQAHLARVARLRRLGLITVTLDWEKSDGAHVARDIALTPAGIAALAEARDWRREERAPR